VLAIGVAIGAGCGAATVSMLNAVAFSFAATILGQSQPPAM
jgi:hypothetical protein